MATYLLSRPNPRRQRLQTDAGSNSCARETFHTSKRLFFSLLRSAPDGPKMTPPGRKVTAVYANLLINISRASAVEQAIGAGANQRFLRAASRAVLGYPRGWISAAAGSIMVADCGRAVAI